MIYDNYFFVKLSYFYNFASHYVCLAVLFDMNFGNRYNVNLLSITSEAEVFEYHIDDNFFANIEDSILTGGDIDVKCTISLTGNVYSASISYTGEIKTSCDRCLADIYYDADFSRDFVIRFTDDQYDEDEDYIDIPRKDGIIDLSGIIYSDLVLSLPMVVMHEEGECDEEMLGQYSNIFVDDIPEDGIEKDENGVDVRWQELKKLRKN